MKRSFIVLVPRLSAPTTLRPRDWKKSVAPAPASQLNTAHYLDQGKNALSFSLPTSIGRESWMKKKLLAFDQRLVWTTTMWNKYYSFIDCRDKCRNAIPTFLMSADQSSQSSLFYCLSVKQGGLLSMTWSLLYTATNIIISSFHIHGRKRLRNNFKDLNVSGLYSSSDNGGESINNDTTPFLASYSYPSFNIREKINPFLGKQSSRKILWNIYLTVEVFYLFLKQILNFASHRYVSSFYSLLWLHINFPLLCGCLGGNYNGLEN